MWYSRVPWNDLKYYFFPFLPQLCAVYNDFSHLASHGSPTKQVVEMNSTISDLTSSGKRYHSCPEAMRMWISDAGCHLVEVRIHCTWGMFTIVALLCPKAESGDRPESPSPHIFPLSNKNPTPVKETHTCFPVSPEVFQTKVWLGNPRALNVIGQCTLVSLD